MTAAKDVNLRSADNTSTSTTNSSSRTAAVGVSISLATGTVNNVSISGSRSSGNANEDSTTHTETVVTAKDTLTVKSGADTNLIGAQAKGDTVKLEVGGNLNIASQQDTENYKERNSSAGGTIGFGANVSSNVSASRGKTDSTYASVQEQSGIFAGQGGFNITVGNNTDLKGAVIASEATPDKNKLSTGTLTYSDIENRAEYKSSSVGFGVSFGGTKKTVKDGKVVEEKNGLSIAPNIGMPASDDASSTTKSAVSPGTIEVRSNPNQDLSGLSRDPAGAVNALGKIFDKATVKERQELSKLFGEIAFEEVHKLSKKNGWKEGSPEKIALHALVGGIMAQLGGGSFASGALGAGVNEAIQNELAKIKDPALRQWASLLVGAAAAKAAGGDAQTGGSTAASGTKNNALNNVEIRELKGKLREALTREQPASKEEVMQIITEYYNLSGQNAVDQILSIDFTSPEGASFKQFLSQYLGYDWDKAVQTLGSDNAAWENLRNHVNNQYDNVVVRSNQAEQTLQQVYQSPRYAGLSDDRKEILYKIDTANNLGDKLVFVQQFAGQGWVERITDFRDSQYQQMLAMGIPESLAKAGADAITIEVLGPVVGSAIRTGDVAGSGLGNLNRVFSSEEVAAAYQGVRIINKRYAGQVYQFEGELAVAYPNGVRFTKDGFPDLTPYAKLKMPVEGMTGTTSDFALANKAAGFSETPAGYTWHHVENGQTMLLVPTTLHQAVRHTGGAALLRNGRIIAGYEI